MRHDQFHHVRQSRNRQLAAKLVALIAIVIARLLPSSGALADDLRVVTTIKPVHALAAQVLDGIATPKLLIKGAMSPHTYALKPSDAEAVHHAQVFVRIAPSVEPFTKKVVASLPKSVRVVTLMEAPGLEILGIRDSGAFESHDHAAGHDSHDPHDDHVHATPDHVNEPGHAHGNTVADPHIWLDPRNAADMVRTLTKELLRLAPEHKKQLQKNEAATLAGLENLERDLRAKLAAFGSQRFIVFHDAFQYFEKRFGLQAAGAITLHPEAPPSGKRLTEIRKKIKSVGAGCVFSEPQFHARRIATVVEGTGAKTGVLDPIGTNIPSGPGAYEAMMHKLADSVVRCLGH